MSGLVGLWIFFGLLLMLLGSRRGDHPLTWFIAGVLLGPFALLLLRFAGKPCPFCRSRINTKATVCPKCRRDIPVISGTSPQSIQQPGTAMPPVVEKRVVIRWPFKIALGAIVLLFLAAAIIGNRRESAAQRDSSGAGTNSPPPPNRPVVSDSSPVPEHAILSSYIDLGRTWKSVLVHGQPGDESLIALGRELHSKLPGISFNIYNDRSQIRNCEWSDMHYPERRGCSDKWISQHYVAMINRMLVDRNTIEWQMMFESGSLHPGRIVILEQILN